MLAFLKNTDLFILTVVDCSCSIEYDVSQVYNGYLRDNRSYITTTANVVTVCVVFVCNCWLITREFRKRLQLVLRNHHPRTTFACLGDTSSASFPTISAMSSNTSGRSRWRSREFFVSHREVYGIRQPRRPLLPLQSNVCALPALVGRVIVSSGLTRMWSDGGSLDTVTCY